MPTTEILERRAHASDFIYQRHSVRAYRPDPLDEPLIIRLLDAAVHAPTAMHQEPCRFVVIQNRALLARLSEEAKAMAVSDRKLHGSLLKPPGAPGHGIPSPLADPSFNIFYDAGTLVLICGAPSNEFVAADCWLAAENLMLAASAEGLGSCCIGFALHAVNTLANRVALGVGAEREVFVAIVLGVPREQTMPSPRRTAVVLSWIR